MSDSRNGRERRASQVSLSSLAGVVAPPPSLASSGTGNTLLTATSSAPFSSAPVNTATVSPLYLSSVPEGENAVILSCLDDSARLLQSTASDEAHTLSDSRPLMTVPLRRESANATGYASPRARRMTGDALSHSQIAALVTLPIDRLMNLQQQQQLQSEDAVTDQSSEHYRDAIEDFQEVGHRMITGFEDMEEGEDEVVEEEMPIETMHRTPIAGHSHHQNHPAIPRRPMPSTGGHSFRHEPQGGSADNSRSNTPVPHVTVTDMTEEQLAAAEQALRKSIREIQSDLTLSPKQKAQRMQLLMTSRYDAARNSKRASNSDFGQDTLAAIYKVGESSSASEATQSVQATPGLENNKHESNLLPSTKATFDLKPSYYDEANKILGCSHYQRGCKVFAECCKTWVTCRLCHNQTQDHEMDRFATRKMMCMHCQTIQNVSNKCIQPSCQKSMAAYYCSTCHLWEDNEERPLFHCTDCGICRQGHGLGQDYFHCKQCGTCMSMNMKDRHRCIERALDGGCPICSEHLFESTETVIFMQPCGHSIHQRCYNELIESSYQCPICWKSLGDMSQYFRRIDQLLLTNVMPEEYRHLVATVLCNDCEKRSDTAYHFMYHKCQSCHSYNTKLLGMRAREEA